MCWWSSILRSRLLSFLCRATNPRNVGSTAIWKTGLNNVQMCTTSLVWVTWVYFQTLRAFHLFRAILRLGLKTFIKFLLYQTFLHCLNSSWKAEQPKRMQGSLFQKIIKLEKSPRYQRTTRVLKKKIMFFYGNLARKSCKKCFPAEWLKINVFKKNTSFRGQDFFFCRRYWCWNVHKY